MWKGLALRLNVNSGYCGLEPAVFVVVGLLWTHCSPMIAAMQCSALIRLVNPSSTARRCVFLANPR